MNKVGTAGVYILRSISALVADSPLTRTDSKLEQ